MGGGCVVGGGNVPVPVKGAGQVEAVRAEVTTGKTVRWHLSVNTPYLERTEGGKNKKVT